MAAHDEETNGFSVVFFEHIPNREEVAQRLGHLFVVHVDEAVVHPCLGKRLAGGAFALGNFVFVMGELQVSTAAMNVKALAQQLAAHGRALNVPAGAAFTKLALPFHIRRLIGLGGFPQHKVQRIMLAVSHCHALARVQLVQRLARQLAVAGELAHGVVHIAITRLIGQTLGLQSTNHAQHLRHVFGGAWLQRGAFNAQRIGILMQRVDHAISQAADGFAVFHRSLDDLVINIGDVAHIGHLVAGGT